MLTYADKTEVSCTFAQQNSRPGQMSLVGDSSIEKAMIGFVQVVGKVIETE